MDILFIFVQWSSYFDRVPILSKTRFVFSVKCFWQDWKLKVQYDSKSGSQYFYTKEGMYRLSNHWEKLKPQQQMEIGTIGTRWRWNSQWIQNLKLVLPPGTNFIPTMPRKGLYYLEVNYVKNTVNYQHKNNPNYDNKAILRTSFETTKKIKQIEICLIWLLGQNILNTRIWTICEKKSLTNWFSPIKPWKK